MTDHGGEFGYPQGPPQRMSHILAAAGELTTEIACLAGSISEARMAALHEVSPALAGTALAEQWPLSEGRLRNLFRGIAVGRLTAAQSDETDFYTQDPYNATRLEDGQIHSEILNEAYPGSASPRLSFATDIVRWADALSGKGHDVVLRLDLGLRERGLTYYTVFEGNEHTEEYLRQLSDPGSVSLSDQALGFRPYSRVSDRVIVHGTEEQIAQLTAATQPSFFDPAEK